MFLSKAHTESKYIYTSSNIVMVHKHNKALYQFNTIHTEHIAVPAPEVIHAVLFSIVVKWMYI